MDFKIHTYASLPSTQDYVKELGSEGLPEGTVIQCLEQQKGRGRQGKKWYSPIGNLYMSVLLRPDCAVRDAGQLSFVAAVALSSAMDGVLDEPHRKAKTLKWPNDILIDGKKLSGILIEKEGSAYALGIGVNILVAPEGAVCLKDVSGKNRVSIHPFRDTVLEKLESYYHAWQEKGFAAIRKEWLSQAHGLNKKLKVSVSGKEQEGLFKEINEQGSLILEDFDGKIFEISSGEVFFTHLTEK